MKRFFAKIGLCLALWATAAESHNHFSPEQLAKLQDAYEKGLTSDQASTADIELGLFLAGKGKDAQKSAVKDALKKKLSTPDPNQKLISLGTYAYRLWKDPIFLENAKENLKEVVKSHIKFEKDSFKSKYAIASPHTVIGLQHLYEVSGEKSFHDTAVKKAETFTGRSVPEAHAYLTLYNGTGRQKWLKKAESAFRRSKLPKNIEHQISWFRISNLLYHFTGKSEYQKIAKEQFSKISNRDFKELEPHAASVLLIQNEHEEEPVHITVVGSRGDPKAKELHRAALMYPALYRRIEWWDPKKDKLPRNDVTYPQLPKPAAFACSGQLCSLPIFTAEELPNAVAQIRK